MSELKKKILLIGGHPRTLVNFRGPLLKAILAQGHSVFAAANGRDQDTEEKLRAIGVAYYPIRIARAGMNPLVDIVTLFDLIRLMRKLKPDVVLSYTIKPVIYSGLAARFCGVPSIYSLITGLGYAFVDAVSPRQHLIGWLAKSFYRLSLCHSRLVFFQNPDDKQKFVKMGLVTPDQGVVVNGSGVDLSFFPFVPFEQENLFPSVPFRFLLISRLLRDKGIGEYVAAARILKKKHPRLEFVLVGGFDPNPTGLKPDEVKAWEAEGLIDFKNEQADVRPFIQSCHVFVLPSYYLEGTPRAVLEAMATGRAIITTDASGCRETVNGRNGILVPVKDVEALAKAMEFFLDHPEQIVAMGRESRAYAQERYDVDKVNAVMLREMGLLI